MKVNSKLCFVFAALDDVPFVISEKFIKNVNKVNVL